MDIPELRIEVERARHETVRVQFELPPGSFDLCDDPEFRFTDPVKGHVEAKMIAGESIHMRGMISTVARAPCVRCLEDLPVTIEAPIDLMFLPEPPASEKRRFARLEEDEKVYYAGDYLRPGEQLREELLLNLPFLPYCELQEGDICPVSGEKVELTKTVGATPEKALEAKAETGNTLGAQLARVRRQLKND